MFIVYSGMITGQIGEGKETCQLTVKPSHMLRNETNYEHRTFWQAILSEQRKVPFFLPAGGTVQRAV